MGNFMDDFFNKSISDVIGSDFIMNSPSLNVVEKENFLQLELAAPGLKKGDFNIQIEEDRLKVSVENNAEKEVTEGRYTRREFDYQSFQRSFNLPETIDQDHIQAAYEQGVLIITLPKLSAVEMNGKRKKIEIS
jgi:HSP20 family protein